MTQDTTPLIVGHRGAMGHSDAPENTIQGFRKAWQLQADWVEFDVQVTSDGHLVVIHDATLERTTNGQGLVSATSLAHIQQLDAGGGAWVPTLKEALEFCSSPLGVNVEVKAKGVARKLCLELQHCVDASCLSWESLIVSSFHWDELCFIKEFYPQIRVGVLLGADDSIDRRALQQLRPYSVHLPRPLVTKLSIEWCHGMAMPVFCYTVNDPSEIERMASLGVQGIITDYPDRAYAVVHHNEEG